MELSRKIVFYDGDCGLCNRSVAYVLRNEKHNEIHFASIQSKFTIDFFSLRDWDAPDLSTFYFFNNEVLYERSTAALQLSKELKYPHRLLSMFFIVPRFFRDAAYDFIAKRRRRISKGFCVMPKPGDKERFFI